MAQIGGGGKNNVTIELNLVPFIDLMSVCIIFLLISAVWTQVSMIQIGSSVYGKRTETETSEPPPRPEVAFRLDVINSGYVINVGKTSTPIPKKNDLYDEAALYAALVDIKTKYPDKVDAIIAVADEINYDDMIKGMDMLLNAGFPEIGVATGGAK